MNDFVNNYIEVLTKKYALFDGRARRNEYWSFVLVNILAYIALSIVDAILAAIIGFGVLAMLYSLAVLVPSIAIGIRRLHDIGKSGWFLLIGLIPFVGGLILIYFFVQPGNAGSNEYGPDPKAAAGAVA